MPSERAIVDTLNRRQLLDLVAHFDLPVPDRRVRDNLVHALASTRRARIGDILQQLSVASLKDICRKHAIDDSGRQKAPLIARILADSARKRVKAAARRKPTAANVRPAAPAKRAKKVAKATPRKEPKPTRRKPATAAKKAAAPKAAARRIAVTPQPIASSVDALAELTSAKPTPFGMQMTAAAVREALKDVEPHTYTTPHAFEPAIATRRHVTCAACGQSLELRKCSAQRCDTLLVSHPSRKICAECMFERNNLSMDDFNQRLLEDSRCPHCSEGWEKQA